MARKTIETISYNYDPVNNYIDDQARLKRSAGSWRYAKSTALILVAAGILAVLLAWAYHIYKKPHPVLETNKTQNERVVNDLIEKDKNIKNLKEKLESDSDNQDLKDRIEKLENEKAEIEEKLKEKNEKIVDGKRVVYNESAVKFSKYPENPDIGDIVVTTGFQWDTVDSMRYGEPHTSSWCYLGVAGEGESISYWFDSGNDQSVALREMNITETQAKSYKKYCAN